MTTIPNLVANAVNDFHNREAVVDGDLRWTFEEYADQINGATKAFISKGIQPGDRIAVWAPNTARWPVAALGAHCAGAVLVPINTRFKGETFDIILMVNSFHNIAKPLDLIDLRIFSDNFFDFIS